LSKYMDDFPALWQTDKKGNRLSYLDNSATTQKPVCVLQAIENYYRQLNANPHRGAYELSLLATNALDRAREKVRSFIGAKNAEDIIFTKNATEALNLIAVSYGGTFLNEGDQIVIAISEHHSNLVPWQQIARQKKATLTYLYTDEKGVLSPEEINSKITEGTKLVAAAHVSNVTGQINPIELIIERAHQVGAVAVIDGTQSVPHIAVDVTALEADFYVFSGHKMLAPMGIGILYGKSELLQRMPPFLFGGDMIEYVEEQTSTFAPLPQKFEAGTPNVEGAAGLVAAIEYIEAAGINNIHRMELELTQYMLERLLAVPYLKILGSDTVENRIGVVPFTMENVHPHDIATILNSDNIAIRSGHHCAQPFHRFLGVPATCRASVYLYNTREDIDRLADSLKGVRRWLGYGA
jgi:cysteine desulfurase/selenocysteine lyase